MSSGESPGHDLSLFSYEILGLVGRGGASAHDLRRMAREGRILDWAGESRYYTEPKRLAACGYLDARTEPGRTRDRTVYTLTEKGLGALRAYARRPARFEPVKSDLLLRLLIADLVGEVPTREATTAMRAELDELDERVDAADARAEALPHRRKYLVMVTGYLRRHLDLHRELIAEIERELAPAPRRVSRSARTPRRSGAGTRRAPRARGSRSGE